jgi:hypothetical protein
VVSERAQRSRDEEQQTEATDKDRDSPTGDGESARDGSGTHDRGIPGDEDQEDQAERSSKPTDHARHDQDPITETLAKLAAKPSATDAARVRPASHTSRR